MTQQLRDILVQTGAVIVALMLGAALSNFMESRWEAALAVALLFAANAFVKLRWPTNWILASMSWLYFWTTFAIFESAVVLLSDVSIAGYWTVPSVIGLGLLYCVVHLVLGPREG